MQWPDTALCKFFTFFPSVVVVVAVAITIVDVSSFRIADMGKRGRMHGICNS